MTTTTQEQNTQSGNAMLNPDPVAALANSESISKTDIARQAIDDGLVSLAASLNEGNSQHLNAYLTTMARFHQYSFGNSLLITSQREDATQVAGFHTWKRLGRIVKKGEKGIVILAPIIRRTEGDVGTKERTRRSKPTETEGICGFKATHVFDISQTEGKELPEFARVTGDPAHNLTRLKAFIQNEGIALEYRDDLNGAEGLSCKGRIIVLPNLSPAHEFSTLVHELAHELLHQTAEARKTTTETIRETEAEAVTYVVSTAIGLDNGGHSCDYIRLWNGEPTTFAASLETIRRTAHRILTALEQLEQQEDRV